MYVVVMGAIPTWTGLLFGVVCFGIGDGVSNPIQKNLLNDRSPDHLRAGAISAATMLQNVGKTGGPLLMGGVLAVIGVRFAFLSMGLVAGLGGAALLIAVWVLRG